MADTADTPAEGEKAAQDAPTSTETAAQPEPEARPRRRQARGETRMGRDLDEVREAKPAQAGHTLLAAPAMRALRVPGEDGRPTYVIGETGTYVLDEHVEAVRAIAAREGFPLR